MNRNLSTQGLATKCTGMAKFNLACVLLLMVACTPKVQLRTADLAISCRNKQEACSESYIERYPEHDLAFIEFTEGGNLYTVSYTHLTLPTKRIV